MTHLSPPVRSPRPLEASHDWGGCRKQAQSQLISTRSGQDFLVLGSWRPIASAEAAAGCWWFLWLGHVQVPARPLDPPVKRGPG